LLDTLTDEISNQFLNELLKLIEINLSHPSLHLHKLEGKLSDLYSVSINISYRICIDFIVEENTIIPIDIGKHDNVY